MSTSANNDGGCYFPTTQTKTTERGTYRWFRRMDDVGAATNLEMGKWVLICAGG